MDSFKTKKPTLSEESKKKYLSRFQRMRDTIATETGKSDLTPDEVVANLILRKPTLSMSSWRAYKSSILYVLETRFPHLTAAIEQLRGETSEGLTKISGNSSGRKRKEVPEAEWQSIQSVLMQRVRTSHKHAQGVLHVLIASLQTGLRPSEWCAASISVHAATGREVLRVQNAKNTNGRANGEYRELFIDELGEVERDAIKGAIAYCFARTTKDMARIQLAMKNEFEIARDKVIVQGKQRNSSVTLYSFRHQFIADAKKTFDDPVLIAALVGHSSTKTAFEHYGKRRNGRGKIKVYPTPESVAEVHTIRLETYRDFVAQRTTHPRPNL